MNKHVHRRQGVGDVLAVSLPSTGHEVAEAYRHAVDDALLFVETAGVILGHASPDELIEGMRGSTAIFSRRPRGLRRRSQRQASFFG